MRKLFTLTLVSYLVAFSFPFMIFAETTEPTDEEVENFEFGEGSSDTESSSTSTTTVDNSKAAAGQVDYVCNSTYAFKYNTSTGEDEEDAKEGAEEIDALYGSKLGDSYDDSGKTCGKTNSISGFLEKGDCTAAGKVVTEITEVIAPDVLLDEDGDGDADNEVITVYAGLCCMGYEIDDDGNFEHCDDVRTVYTETYEGCDSGTEGNGYYMDKGPYGNEGKEGLYSCEKRQWVIGDSGIGIVKLMVKQIFTFGVLAVGSIAVSTIVFQGIKISVSGVSGDITESKNKILQAIGGIVLLFLSGLILYAINPTFFG